MRQPLSRYGSIAIRARPDRSAAAISLPPIPSPDLGYMVVLVGAGTVLAAVLAFAPSPLYPAYAHPTMLGLSPSGDQQLAGLVMLAEQVVAFSICAVFLLRPVSGVSRGAKAG